MEPWPVSFPLPEVFPAFAQELRRQTPTKLKLASHVAVWVRVFIAVDSRAPPPLDAKRLG